MAGYILIALTDIWDLLYVDPVTQLAKSSNEVGLSKNNGGRKEGSMTLVILDCSG
jgi:hypothetical protein